MKQKEINNERYSQEEIDAIIDEIIEKEPVKEIKEHLIKSSQIEQYKSSFVTKDYKNRESDIVYKDNINKGIYYLIEHQSKQDKMMPMRIAEYSIEIIKEALDFTKRNKKYEIPRVITIVLYTGESKWQVSQTLEAIQVKLPEIESQSVGSYNIVDINTYSDDELLKAKGTLPKMLLMEKNIKNLTDEAKKIEDCNFTEEERERISIYITNVIREVNYDLAEKLLEKINIEEGKNMRLGQALVDYWYDGVAKGEEKRKKRRQKRGLCFWKAKE